MVALLNPNTFGPSTFVPESISAPSVRSRRNSNSRALQRQALDGAIEQAGRPVLRVIEGGASASRRMDATLVAGLLAALMLVAAVIGVRMAQGTPPEAFGVTANSAIPAEALAPAVPGESVVEVVAGQNLWDIARTLNTESDLRSTVAALADRNGGASVAVGQQIVIPASVGATR